MSSNSQKSVSGTGGAGSVFDYDISSAWYEDSTNFYVQLQWSNWIPQINAFSINTYYSRSSHPSTFTIYGGAKGSSSATETLLSKEDVEYSSNDENMFSLVTNEKIWQIWRVEITKTGSTSLRFNEMSLLTCRYAIPDKLELTASEITAVANVDSISVGPVYDGFTSCSIVPDPPSGLSLNQATCTLSGVPQVTVDTTYTIKATMPFESEATLKLTVTECTKTVLEVERVYGSYSYAYETHWLRSLSGTTVERVLQNTVQKASTTIKNRYCIDSGLYELTVDQVSSNQWTADSYIMLNTVYGSEIVPVLRWKYDLAAGYNPSITVYLGDTIPRESEWSYLMGSLPDTWMDDTIPEAWSKGKMGEFGESTNHMQLYKKSFELEDEPVGSAFEMGIRYKYGCVVVINGIEMFRNNIAEGENLTEPATGTYDDVMYRRISLPVSLPAEDGETELQVLKKGTNVVTILLLATSESETTSYFDASLHLFGRETVGRVFDFTALATDNENVDYLFDMSSLTFYESTSCSAERYVQITFNDDRREWISKYVLISSTQEDKQAPASWRFEGSNGDEWIPLDNVTSTIWWSQGQQKEVWVNNAKPYNSYRLVQITGPNSECTIDLMQICLFSDSLVRGMPELSYNGNSTGYLNVDFTDLSPNSNYYKNFEASPALPSFLTLDPLSGIIRGSEVSLYPITQHTISAYRLNGTISSTVLSIRIIECDMSMIELVIRTDSYPAEQSYALYQGKDTSGDPVASKDSMDYRNQYNYKYFCLDRGIYTFKFQDTYGDGWAMPSGYRIVTYQGYALGFGTVPSSSEKPVIKTQTFSTYIVAMPETTDWRSFTGSSANRNWKTVGFDDSSWITQKGGAEIPYNGKTIYFRYTFNIPDISTYPVLNVAINYASGIVGYLNGVKVYRSNLPEEVSYDTDATQDRTSYGFVEFAIPLQLKGGVTGNNVLAFELHRTSQESSSSNCRFNAHAILATGDCAITRADVLSYSSSTPNSGTYTYALFDTTVYNYVSWDWVQGTYFNFTYENLEGSLFNQYRFYTDGNPGNVDYTIYAKRAKDEVWYTFDRVKSATFPDRSRYEKSAPNGLIGFNQFMVVFDGVQYPTGFTIDEVEFAYCSFSTTQFCPASGDYPMTGDGQMSVALCPEFYDGYSYRMCNGDRFGDVVLDNCVKFAPTNMAFSQPRYTLYVNAEARDIVPEVYGIVDDYAILPRLPDGLYLDEKTGEVKGTPTNVTTTIETYTVTGYNEMGSDSASFELLITIGWCDPDELFPRTPLGETAVYDCAEQGTSGTLRRTCRMGRYGPEWGMTIGVCMSGNTFAALIIVVVVVIIIIVVVVIKVRKDKKKVMARSAVRGGKKNINIMKSVPYSKI